MAYPFREWPDVEGFVEELRAYGVQRVDLETEGVVGLIRRVGEGSVRVAVVESTGRVGPGVYRSVCNSLGLDIREILGFDLG